LFFIFETMFLKVKWYSLEFWIESGDFLPKHLIEQTGSTEMRRQQFVNKVVEV